MKTKNKNNAKSTIVVCLVGAVMLMGVLAGIMMIESGSAESAGTPLSESSSGFYEPKSAPRYTTHAPIYITSNANFTDTSSKSCERTANFLVNDSAVTTDVLNVRDSPSLSGNIIATQETGTIGFVLDGPVNADGYTWWKIRWVDTFSTPLVGWSSDHRLQKYDAPVSTRFTIGDPVVTCNLGTSHLMVRTNPPELHAEVNDKVPEGTFGTIIEGPLWAIPMEGYESYARFYHYWMVDYDDGHLGWSAEGDGSTYLETIIT